MTKKQFLRSVSNGQEDILQQFLDILEKKKIRYCVIGGLAVNAYVEPVVSLDLDIIIIAESIDELIQEAKKRFKIERFLHSINLTSPKSDIRIQIQIDSRYQAFIPRATSKKVLGYTMQVAAIEDVMQGKLWAYADEQRRKSKRQKDLADIYRLVEKYPKLKKLLPESLINKEI